MEMKNICGKIPVALHLKVRAEIEQREISTQQFIQQVIEEHFMEKGVNRMEARTIAVQVSEQLFTRLKNVVAWKGCKQKEFLIRRIGKCCTVLHPYNGRNGVGRSCQKEKGVVTDGGC